MTGGALEFRPLELPPLAKVSASARKVTASRPTSRPTMPEVAPQPRVHGAARAASADFKSSARPSKSSGLSAEKFYSEYHGHRVGDLQVLLPALRPRAVTWLVGDSSLDNKHWLFDARRDGSDTTALPLCAAACSKWPLGGATARQPVSSASGCSTHGARTLPLSRGGSGATVLARQPALELSRLPTQVPATRRCCGRRRRRWRTWRTG